MMERETTDPLAAGLLQDIISEMEAELKELVSRLPAERHEAPTCASLTSFRTLSDQR